MAILIGRDESYDSLRPYLPEDAKAVLEKELPRIRKSIEGEIDDFTKSFGEQIKAQMEEQKAAIAKDSADASGRLTELLQNVTVNAGDAAKLAQNAKELQAEITAYRQKWEGMGKSVQDAVLNAARSIGVPIPPTT